MRLIYSAVKLRRIRLPVSHKDGLPQLPSRDQIPPTSHPTLQLRLPSLRSHLLISILARLHPRQLPRQLVSPFHVTSSVGTVKLTFFYSYSNRCSYHSYSK